MASCPKCARRNIRKRRDGLRWCRRCGCLPNQKKLRRDGTKPAPTEGDSQ